MGIGVRIRRHFDATSFSKGRKEDFECESVLDPGTHFGRRR